MSFVNNLRHTSLQFENIETKDDNKENLSKSRTFSSTTLQPRRRHLSLVDTNRYDVVRINSVSSEVGGWNEGGEVILDKDKLGSAMDSLQKYRKILSSVKVEDVYGDGGDVELDDTVLSVECIPSETSFCGTDWYDIINNSEGVEDLDDSVFPSRSRFLSVVDSMKKNRSSSLIDIAEVNEKFDIILTKEDILPLEDFSTSADPNLTSIPLPEDVVDIDKEDGKTDCYEPEIVIYMRKLEKSFILDLDFLEESSVTHTMRSILVDWLVQVQHHLKLDQETLYRTVAIIDMVLDRRDVDPDTLQLLGITSLLVATKVEEYYPADLKKLLHLTQNSYKLREVLEMELVLVEVLDFQLYIPSPQVFLLRYTQASLHPSDPTFLKTCQYLLDSHLPSPSHSCIPPSVLAAAAVLSTSLLYFITTSASNPFTTTIWTPTLIFYTKYSLAELLDTSLSLIDMSQSSIYTGANTKYTSLSQHSRLVLKNHLLKEVVDRARKVMEEWSTE